MKSYVNSYKWQILTALMLSVALLVDPAWAAGIAPVAGLMMTVDAIKSTVITNIDATPSVINNAQLQGGRIRHARGKGTLLTAAAEAGSTIRCFRVKSNDIVHKLWLDATSFGTGSAANIGLYQTTANGGAAADADLFASAVSLAAAQRATDVTTESGVITVANMEKCIWELLGLTADPHREYDVTISLSGAATVAGTACLSGEIVGRN